jgi:hypothetical protein
MFFIDTRGLFNLENPGKNLAKRKNTYPEFSVSV